MKNKNLKLVLLILISLTCFDAYAAPDTSIRVVAISANGADTTVAALNMNQIGAVWQLSAPTAIPYGTPMNTPISIDILNFGVPVPISFSYNGTNTASQNLSDLRTNINQTAVRGLWSADVVIVFVPDILYNNNYDLICGATTSPFVEGNYFPDPNNFNMDLSDANYSYIALVSTDPLCQEQQNQDYSTAAHELGHIAGGAHQTSYGLYTSDRAHVGSVNYNGTSYGWRSVVGAGTSVCLDLFNNYICTNWDFYSYSPGYDNKHTINYTVQSVANYFPTPPPPPPPSCSLSTPENLSKVYLGCYNGVAVHSVSWDDACPAATDFYPHMYSTQSNGFDLFGYSVFGIVYADGSSSYSQAVYQTQSFIHLKVLACDVSGCEDYYDPTHITLYNPCSNY